MVQREPRGVMTKRQQAKNVLGALYKRYPTFETHLVAHSPWELLIATILSAQCTDARVNQVTPVLFRRWPDAFTLAHACFEDVMSVVKPTGFYKNKAKHIIEAAKRIVNTYQGVLPQTMEDLITLPGVARKTANIVLWGAFNINVGIAVDTHVKRIAYRLGLTKHKDPIKIEQDLMALFPQSEWGAINHKLVWFGRHVCSAKNPLCHQCEMVSFCSAIGVKRK